MEQDEITIILNRAHDLFVQLLPPDKRDLAAALVVFFDDYAAIIGNRAQNSVASVVIPWMEQTNALRKRVDELERERGADA